MNQLCQNIEAKSIIMKYQQKNLMKFVLKCHWSWNKIHRKLYQWYDRIRRERERERQLVKTFKTSFQNIPTKLV